MTEPALPTGMTVDLDPVADHYRRQRDFLQNETLVLSAKLRDANGALRIARAEIERLETLVPSPPDAEDTHEEEK